MMHLDYDLKLKYFPFLLSNLVSFLVFLTLITFAIICLGLEMFRVC